MTLGLYIARQYVWALARVLLIVTGIVMLIEIVENVRRLSGQDEGMRAVFFLAALKFPAAVDQVMPLVILISSLTLFLGLARSSELVIFRASGVSAIRLVLIPTLLSIILGLLSIAILNPIVAATTKRYDAVRAEMSGQAQTFLSISDQGLWLRQVMDGDTTVIQAARASPDGAVLFDVQFHIFDPSNILKARVLANRATLTEAAWVLSDVRRWTITTDADALPAPRQVEKAREIATNLTSDQILDSFAKPETISIWDLPQFISQLQHSGFTATRHKQFLQNTLAIPALFAAMVLIGAGFTMRHVRFGNVGIMVIFAVLMGFALYFLRNISGSLGSAGEIPIIIAAWAPPVAAMLLVIGLLLHLEDG